MNRGPRWLWLDEVHAHVRDGALSPTAGHIALALAVHYVNGRQEAWPSQQELVAATGRSRSSVKRALRELEEHGLLEHRHGSPARTFGNVYGS